MLTRRTWGLSLAAAVAVAGVGAVYFGLANSVAVSSDALKVARQPEPSQATLVKSTFSAAMQAAQSAGSPSGGYVTASLSGMRSHAAMHAVPAAARTQLLTAGRRELARYFSPELVSREEVGLNHMLLMDASADQVNLGSGVTKVVFRSVAVAGRSASIEADVTVWAKSYTRQSNQGPWIYSDPVNTLAYVATMTRASDGSWQVSSLAGDFLPGEGP